MPLLALPKNTSEHTKHLREPGRSFQSPVRGGHWAQLATKQMPQQIHILPEKPTSAQLQRTKSEQTKSRVILWFLHPT